MSSLLNLKYRDNSRNLEIRRQIDSSELQISNFVKDKIIPLQKESAIKLNAEKNKKQLKKQRVNSLDVNSFLKGFEEISTQTMKLQNKIEAKTSKKLRTTKPFYEYTSLEMDKLKNEVEKIERRKVFLPPILIRNQKSKSKIVCKSKEFVKNKTIKFEISTIISKIISN